MIRSFQYPLYPNSAQEAALTAWLAGCCSLYNAALEERREAWRKQRVGITLYQQQKELTLLRAADPEFATIPVWVARSALARLDVAFKGFFRRCKLNEKPGFPRFRSASRYKTFDLGHDQVRNSKCVVDDRVALPTIGLVRFRRYRDPVGVVKLVRVSRQVTGWCVSFICEVGVAPAKTTPTTAVGIDVGLEAFATLSAGERIENPRFFRVAENALARRQQFLAKKKRGSASREAAKVLVAKAHEHIRNQRLDFARKLAATLLSRFDLIAHEDLTISRMVHGNLAKSIYDAGWGVFLRCLALKAENAGRHVIAVDPRLTSQTCAACGAVARKTLDERQHTCSSCSFVAHRDHNAALVILGRGLRLGQLTEIASGSPVAVKPASTTESTRTGEQLWVNTIT